LAAVSSSDDTLASAKAIKAYVDSQVTAQDLDFAGDTGNGAVDLDSEVLTIAGTANEIETSASNQTLTIGLPNEVAITTSLVVGSGVTITGSTVQVGGTITELYNGQFWNVVTQADVGYGASQVPLNQYLGQLAFLDDHHPNGLRRDGGGSDDVFVKSDGFVGIGTDDPSQKLDVRGNLIVSGITTTGTLYVGAAGTVGITTILDEDGLTSNRDDALATQQSIKAYVDSEVSTINTSIGNIDLDFSGDTGTGAIDLDSETLTIAGTTNEIETVGSGNTITIGLPNDVTISNNLDVGDSITALNSLYLGSLSSPTFTLSKDLLQYDSGIFDFSASELKFSIYADGEKARLTSTGLGIGITNPSEKLHVTGNIAINQTTVVGSVTASLSTLTETAIHTGLSTSTYRSVEYNIQATQGTNYHVTKILALHNGTTAYHNEYGTIFNNTSVATFNVDVSGGNIRLLGIGATSDQTDYVVNFTATKL
jgi:hypothetical protein